MGKRPEKALHPVEEQMVQWWAAGKQDADIELLMGVSKGTASNRARRVLDRFGWATRASAVAAYLRSKHKAELVTLRAELSAIKDHLGV